MKNDKEILDVIMSYIFKLERYTYNIDIDDFVDNEEKYDACCLVLQQIWEVGSKLNNNILLDFPISQMRWLRNRITHDYIWLDSEIIWDTIVVSIPELKNVIQDYLNNL